MRLSREPSLEGVRWRGSQVVRQRFAKPSYVGSNPIHASQNTKVTTAGVTTEGLVTLGDPSEPPSAGDDPPPSHPARNRAEHRARVAFALDRYVRSEWASAA